MCFVFWTLRLAGCHNDGTGKFLRDVCVPKTHVVEAGVRYIFVYMSRTKREQTFVFGNEVPLKTATALSVAVRLTPEPWHRVTLASLSTCECLRVNNETLFRVPSNN